MGSHSSQDSQVSQNSQPSQLSPKTSAFIKAHLDDDVRRLALSASGDTDIDLPFALDQIAGRRTALRKLPSWAAVDGLVYPPHLSMEQCSSEPAALYKAVLAERLTDGGSFVDITGGFGVDFSFIARGFRRAVYVERQERLCDIASHNMGLLGLPQAVVVNGDGMDYVRQSEERFSLIFVDPARRDNNGGRTFAISDCTPDILGEMDMLLGKADHVMIKLSPMLDWRKAVADIGPAVREVHIVSVGNECKELLIVAGQPPLIHPERGRTIRVVAVRPPYQNDHGHRTVGAQYIAPARNIADCQQLASLRAQYIAPLPADSAFLLHPHEVEIRTSRNEYEVEGEAFSFYVTADTLQVIDDDNSPVASSPLGGIEGSRFLYEPDASIMKAGCFGLVERRYGVRQIDRNSHLFVSHRLVDGFPGRRFAVNAVTTLNKKELRKALAGVERANIATRNFPMPVDALRKRLRLADGGDTYIFATTLADRSHVLFVCSGIRA